MENKKTEIMFNLVYVKCKVNYWQKRQWDKSKS